jgi:hypothetical protein
VAAIYDEAAIHEHERDPFWELPRLVVGRRVAHALGIEADDVCRQPGPEQAAVVEAEPLAPLLEAITLTVTGYVAAAA